MNKEYVKVDNERYYTEKYVKELEEELQELKKPKTGSLLGDISGVKIWLSDGEYKEYKNDLRQENKQLKRTLSATETNEETFRLEMEEITQILGLHEDTIFDDVKIYARYLVNIQNNWNKLKEFINLNYYDSYMYSSTIINKMQELESGDSNE